MGIEFSKRAVIRVIMDAMAGLDSLKDIYDKVEAMEEPTQPEMVEVPDVEQFIADWYEKNKGDLEQAIFDLHVDLYKKSHDARTEFEEWAACGDVRPTETLIRMKDG